MSVDISGRLGPAVFFLGLSACDPLNLKIRGFGDISFSAGDQRGQSRSEFTLRNIGVGKYHTALGYWNHTYHHGTWLQSSILRPEIYLFEFQGGILPDHSVGVEVFGFQSL